MIVRPVFGLLFHLLSAPRPHLDLFVAGGLVLGTVFYMRRIARTCVAYGFEEDGEDKVVYTEVDEPPSENSAHEPYCAG